MPPPRPSPDQPRVLKEGARRTVLDRGAEAAEVVKVFHGGGLRDRLRAGQEARCARRLAQAGVRTPRLVGRGRVADLHGVALRFERVEGATTLGEFLSAPGPRRRAVTPLAELLVSLERAGALLPDLHPGNVLFGAQGNAWVVDVRGARTGRGHRAWRSGAARLIGSLIEEQPGFVAALAKALREALPALDLDALHREARTSRIRANVRRVRVWERTSAAAERGPDGIVRVREGAAPAPSGWTVQRSTADPQAWATLVRAHLHRLPAARPVAFGPGWLECFAPKDARPIAEGPSPALARALACRGLAVHGPLLRDAAGRTIVGPQSRLGRAGELG